MIRMNWRQVQFILALVATIASPVFADCPNYIAYSNVSHAPLSAGKNKLAYQRPDPACRTFNLSEVESTIKAMSQVIKDPDLYRLFENTFPNTLDTTISWKGFAAGTDEELTFVVTGDINAMWLRDSANQMRSYKSLLVANDSTESLASLYRGVINLQSRYILTSPHCNAFQPPTESGLSTAVNSAASNDVVFPTYSNTSVFECKYELDSLSAFLQVSWDYYDKTKDIDFFGKYQWRDAVETILNTTTALLIGTYADDGSVNQSPYTFQRTTTSATETLMNSGAGSPVKGGTGLVRSAFRPSDDSTIYQLFIPANMMFSSYLGRCAPIMAKYDQSLSTRMTEFSTSVRNAIEKWGKVQEATYGEIYAYELDGFGSRNMMDDANVPSLLGAPVIDYLDANDAVYQNTRKFVLSTMNPYYMHGPVISAVGGPHEGPGMAWPMAIIVELLTSDSETEVVNGLKTILSSTDGLGLIHESINTFNATDYTRQWFSWANGLFGQLILDLKDSMPEVLSQSYQ